MAMKNSKLVLNQKLYASVEFRSGIRYAKLKFVDFEELQQHPVDPLMSDIIIFPSYGPICVLPRAAKFRSEQLEIA